MTTIRRFFQTKFGRQVLHVAGVFLFTFLTTLVTNAQHLMGERGLDGLKALAPALVVSAAYMGWLKIVPLLPVVLVQEVEKIVEVVKETKSPGKKVVTTTTETKKATKSTEKKA